MIEGKEERATLYNILRRRAESVGAIRCVKVKPNDSRKATLQKQSRGQSTDHAIFQVQILVLQKNVYPTP